MEGESRSRITGNQHEFIRLSCLISSLFTVLREKGVLTTNDTHKIFEAAEKLSMMEEMGMFNKLMDELEKMK